MDMRLANVKMVVWRPVSLVLHSGCVIPMNGVLCVVACGVLAMY